MIIESALALCMDLSVKPEMDKAKIAKGKFQYKWWEDPCSAPMAKERDLNDEETLFRMLIETMEMESRKPDRPNGLFRNTMGPRAD